MEGKRYLIIVLPKHEVEHLTCWLRDPNQPQGIDCGWTADASGHWLNDKTWDLLLLCAGQCQLTPESFNHAALAVALSGYAVVCVVYHSLDGHLLVDRTAFPDWFVAKYTRDLKDHPKARVLHTLRADIGVPEDIIAELIERLRLSTKERKHLKKPALWPKPEVPFTVIAQSTLAPLTMLDEAVQSRACAFEEAIPERIVGPCDAGFIESAFAQARLHLYIGDSDYILPSATLEGRRLSPLWTVDVELTWVRVKVLLPRSDLPTVPNTQVHDMYTRARVELNRLIGLDVATPLSPEVADDLGDLGHFHQWFAAFATALTELGLRLSESSVASAAGA